MSPSSCAGQRGPAEHERREQIVAAASEHFRHYGYEKTTVADLAKAIGLSKAYIYKFFESKQAIGQAVCASCLGEISGRAQGIALERAPAADRLRRIIRELALGSAELFIHDRRIHDLAATSSQENWNSTRHYDARLLAMIQSVLREGRESGEFERKTSLHETSRAIMLALQTFLHPALLLRKVETLEADAALMANFVLRSLSG